MSPETTATRATGSDGSAGTAALEVSLQINGEARSVPVACSIDALLLLLDLDRRQIAVAINRSVVPRSAFATHRLEAGDRVEILEAVGGG